MSAKVKIGQYRKFVSGNNTVFYRILKVVFNGNIQLITLDDNVIRVWKPEIVLDDELATEIEAILYG